jgi:coenzyme F420-reducing hydrogenase beta subunit
MVADKEGFLYPSLDASLCIECGRCEEVCVCLRQNDKRVPLRVCLATNSDDAVRAVSSSGGLFSLLAEQVLARAGVVFGAGFDPSWKVVHTRVEKIEHLGSLRGSKYVQSELGAVYAETQEILDSGRQVLFAGTPCQIAGLLNCLDADYQNLLTVDFICHGVGSPLVLKYYLQELLERVSHKRFPDQEEQLTVTSVSFREKSEGWKQFSMAVELKSDRPQSSTRVIVRETHKKNLFLRGYIGNLFLRPACYHCPVRSFRSGSDVTLGDSWGLGKTGLFMDDDKGTSLVIIHTPEKVNLSGAQILGDCQLADFERYNSHIRISPKPHIFREDFFRKLEQQALHSLLDDFVAADRKIEKSISKHVFERGKRTIGRMIAMLQDLLSERGRR